ncbi:MAG: hypothetical protein FJ034_04330 [Chloroflexi bacterium]|nr:hypothetical protein [Chloroflexota bacterium]
MPSRPQPAPRKQAALQPTKAPAAPPETARLAAQNATLRSLVEIYDRLTGAALAGSNAAAITSLFAELIAQPVTLFDPALAPIARADQGRARAPTPLVDDPSVKQILASVEAERRPLKLPALPGWSDLPSVFAPVLAGDETLGYLMTLVDGSAGDRSELVLLASQQAATVCALAIIRDRAAADTANRLREDLLAGLLLTHQTDEAETRRRASLLGYVESRRYRVVACALATAPEDDPRLLGMRRRLLEALGDTLRTIAKDAIVVARTNELVALVPEEVAEPQATPGALNSAIDRLRRSYPQAALAAGLGALCTDPTEIAGAYGQARRALTAALRFGRLGRVTSFEDLGVFRLLLGVQDPGELRAFAERVLGPLTEYDRKHGSDLVSTLRAHLRHNGSLQGAARELGVHVNTVGYRLQRIEEIGGLDLGNADDRLGAQLALKIVDGI